MLLLMLPSILIVLPNGLNRFLYRHEGRAKYFKSVDWNPHPKFSRGPQMRRDIRCALNSKPPNLEGSPRFLQKPTAAGHGIVSQERESL